MSFWENRLDECYSFGARGGPVFSSEVVKTVGGRRFANKNWTMPLHRYDISAAIRTNDDFEVLRAFFYNVAGQFDGFRFKDFADFKAVDQPLAVLTEGTSYQLTRAYVRGDRTFYRTVYKPVTSITLVRDRSGSLSTPSASVDYSTGVVTMTGHSTGDVYTWTGEFDVPVVFTSDMLEAVIENKSGGEFLVRWPSIQVEEIRL